MYSWHMKYFHKYNKQFLYHNHSRNFYILISGKNSIQVSRIQPLYQRIKHIIRERSRNAFIWYFFMAYNTLRKFFCHFKRLYFDLHWSHSYPCKIPNLTWGVYHTILHLQPTFFSIYGVKIDAKLYMTNLFSFIFPVVLTSFIIWDLLCYGTSSYCLKVYHPNVILTSS